MLDDDKRLALRQLLPALKALAKSVEWNLYNESYEGTGGMAVKSYRGLQGKVAQILPDDPYVTEALVLEDTPNATDKQRAAQVRMAVSQLVTYVEGQLRSQRTETELEDITDLGRELRDRIVLTTRDAIRRAMSNMDIDIDIDNEPWGTKKKRIVIKGGKEVPHPPEPPEPGEYADIEIEIDEDEEDGPRTV
jgi:hypothetical protein